MGHPADPRAIANQARKGFLQALLSRIPAAVQGVEDGMRLFCTQSAAAELSARRRDTWLGLRERQSGWERSLAGLLKQQQARLTVLPVGAASVATRLGEFSLVDDDTMESEILVSRLALAIMDRASFEFTDLRTRLNHLEQREDMSSRDCLRPHVLARVVIDGWREAGLTLEAWRLAQPVLHEEFSHLLLRGYHDANRWLIECGVLPEIDLRPLVRRTQYARSGSAPSTLMAPFGPATAVGSAADATSFYQSTQLMSRLATLAPAAPPSRQAPLTQLQQWVAAQVPQMESKAGHEPTVLLQQAMADVERQLRSVDDALARGGGAAVTTLLVDGVNETRRALKSATESPIERATIEIVALLFQSILMEERLPASVRVWFARLQMPVLRVAIAEPDFFAEVDHPARRLIDRMGACVMGFDAGTAGAVGPAIEAEIKRVVQVVEAYPDTGRRVFQTVLGEFEQFLEEYFRNENEASRVGVSLAQQVEQREAMSIQYMIELRKMLDEMPVQDGVRDFLFQVWAEVLAMTAVKTGAHSDQTREMKRAAADLIWSASAKVTREERAEVIRRLPPLLKILRDGMTQAGLPHERQEAQLRLLNNALAAAFTAKTAVIPMEQLEELMLRLEALEELLPGGADIEIDESMALDLSSHQSAQLEVVGEGGGNQPGPEMLALASELQVGQWFKLDYRGRDEPVQLAWQGMRRQLSLFASPGGRCVLFQRRRLASFLQAGLLVPAEDEALTVRATRMAMTKLDADPGRLLN